MIDEGTLGSIASRFWDKVAFTEDCWEWTASLDGKGYGQFQCPKGKNNRSHRFAYELVLGPIPGGLNLDHVCNNKICVNPDHLEPVTQKVNIQRALVKDVCHRGHPRTAESTYTKPSTGWRECVICRRVAVRARRG